MARRSTARSSPRREAFAALGDAERDVDAVADLLLSDADRCARVEAARERKAAEQRALEKLAATRDELAARRGAAQAGWAALWERAGVAPRAPRAMTAWLERVGDLSRRRARLAEQALEREALAQKLGGQRDALTRLIEDIGAAADAALPIEALYKHARASVDLLQAGWTEARAGIALRDKALDALARAKESRARIEQESERLLAAWPNALAAIGLAGRPDESPAQAEAALTVWRGVPLQKSKFEDEEHRIATMRDDISAFEKQVAELVALAAPGLRERPSREALDVLSGRLAEARRAHEQRETLRKNAQKRASAGAKLAQRRIGAHERLGAARAKLGLDESAPLAPGFDRLQRRSSLVDDLAELARNLAESADGHDEDALRREQADLEFDLLPGEIERLKIARQQIVDDIATAQTNLHEASRARETLAAGRDAASAAQNKAEAGAALIDVASRWLARASAARLAAKAIERHRAAVQDPLLTRASALFAIATDGAFKALGADYDNDDTPMLVGLRENERPRAGRRHERGRARPAVSVAAPRLAGAARGGTLAFHRRRSPGQFRRDQNRPRARASRGIWPRAAGDRLHPPPSCRPHRQRIAGRERGCDRVVRRGAILAPPRFGRRSNAPPSLKSSLPAPHPARLSAPAVMKTLDAQRFLGLPRLRAE